MVEWFKAPVLKTGDVQASVGSNPTLSANLLADIIEQIWRNTQVVKGLPC